MENKTTKATPKNKRKHFTIFVTLEDYQLVQKFLSNANKKKRGHKIKAHHLFHLCIGFVEDEQIKLLQEQSLTNEDLLEVLRQRYIAAHGPTSRDDFMGFMLSPKFADFLESERGNPIAI